MRRLICKQLIKQMGRACSEYRASKQRNVASTRKHRNAYRMLSKNI